MAKNLTVACCESMKRGSASREARVVAAVGRFRRALVAVAVRAPRVGATVVAVTLVVAAAATAAVVVRAVAGIAVAPPALVEVDFGLAPVVAARVDPLEVTVVTARNAEAIATATATAMRTEVDAVAVATTTAATVGSQARCS